MASKTAKAAACRLASGGNERDLASATDMFRMASAKTAEAMIGTLPVTLEDARKMAAATATAPTAPKRSDPGAQAARSRATPGTKDASRHAPTPASTAQARGAGTDVSARARIAAIAM